MDACLDVVYRSSPMVPDRLRISWAIGVPFGSEKAKEMLRSEITDRCTYRSID